MLEKAIKKALKNCVLHPELMSVMDYAVFPAGKLFRPRLVEALALDLNQKLTPSHLHLAAAIELHHAYTLVHDDLPAMDNDLIRRGKPSTHAQFGEWRAILAGDALLIASFEELAQINHHNFRAINKLMSWTTGAKGLIAGQFLDLMADGKMDFKNVVRVHELKTGRLIQMATLGSYLLTKEQNLRGKIDFLRLGREIGVSFQLLDDLTELAESNVSPHEKSINPFISSSEEALNELGHSIERILQIALKHRLLNVAKMLRDYFEANQERLLKDIAVVEKNIGGDTTKLQKWLTSFV
jgi:geranylgeranyl pyrophosphate synthase